MAFFTADYSEGTLCSSPDCFTAAPTSEQVGDHSVAKCWSSDGIVVSQIMRPSLRQNIPQLLWDFWLSKKLTNSLEIWASVIKSLLSTRKCLTLN